MSDLSHLAAPAKAVIDRPREERVAYMREDHWIGYPKANETFAKLDAMLEWPRTLRPPCMLIVAHTNNGKTSLINKFVQRNPADVNAEGDAIRIPVLLVSSPSRSDEAALYENILKKLFVPFRPTASVRDKQRQVLDVLSRIQPGILAIDEMNSLLAGSGQKQFLNAIRILSNELQLPLVGLGTEDAFRVIATDPQLSNRFETQALPRWECDSNFRRLLSSFEQLLPLKESSNLKDAQTAALLHAMSEGLIGELNRLLVKAVEWALLNGQERIDEQAIASCGFVPPAKRKRDLPRL